MKGFVCAFEGIMHAVRTERNLRFHLCTAVFVTFFAWKFYRFSRAEWAVLFLTFAAVISLELVNTAVERLADKVSPEKDEHIRHCKDCAAGAVLISAVAAVLVGISLFWDAFAIAEILHWFAGTWYRVPALCVAVLAAGIVVFLPWR